MIPKEEQKYTKHIYNKYSGVFPSITLKILIPTTADNTLMLFFFLFFEKERLEISCELSALQKIHMKFQVLFSHEMSLPQKNKINFRMSSATNLLTVFTICIRRDRPEQTV